MKLKTCSAQIKAAGTQDGTDDGVFEAIVATYSLDSVGDRILPGAFAETLAEWKASGGPIPVLWSHMSHDPDYHIGWVEDAEERDEGLWVKARLDLDEPKTAKIYKLLKGRRVTQFSFAYDILDGAYVENRETGESFYELRKLKLYEVGPTLIGANQDTELLSTKQGPVAINVHPGQPTVDADPARGLGEKITGPAKSASLVKAGRALSAKNESRVRDIARLATELLASIEASGESEEEKATPSAPALDAPARPGTASVRLHSDLALFAAEVDELTS